MPLWVVTFSICFALSKPQFIILATCSGVYLECRALDTARLILLSRLRCALAFFGLSRLSLTLVGCSTLTDAINRSYILSAFNELDIEPRTRSDSHSTGAAEAFVVIALRTERNSDIVWPP